MDLLLVEDDLNTCCLLAGAVETTRRFSSIHSAYTFSAATEYLYTKPNPDMMLCDIGLPDGDGLALVSQAVERDIPVIVISAFGDEKSVVGAIELGASGYLHKDLQTDEIARAIGQVLNGGSPLSPSIATHILRRLQPSTDRHDGSARRNCSKRPIGKLTQREMEILQLVARGYLLREVAGELGISNHTVSNHNRNIYRKLSANSRSEAVYNALTNGLLSSD